MTATGLPSTGVLDRLPAGGWAVLVVVILAMVTTAGIQILRLVLDEKYRKQHGRSDDEICNVERSLVAALRLALDRQPAILAEHQREREREHRTLREALAELTVAVKELTRRVINEAERRRD